jgi:fructose-bisphosphate aldolase class 1
MDESNATCGLRLASIGLENTEVNRQAYRQLLVGTPGLGEYVSGAILFEETLYQSTTDGNKMVDVLTEAGIVPGIKVDKVWSHYTDTQNSSSSLLKHCTTTTPPLDSHALSLSVHWSLI